MNGPEDAFQQLITSSNIWWFDQYWDKYSPIDASALTQLLDEGLKLHTQKKLSFTKLLSYVDEKAESVLKDLETDEDYEQVYQLLGSFFYRIGSDNFELILKFIQGIIRDGNWLKADIAFTFLKNFGRKDLEKSVSLLDDLLFESWDDLEDMMYESGDNTAESNIAYHELYVERREMIMEAIFDLDKKSLLDSIERILKDPPFGWNNNLNRLLALKYQFKLDKKKGVKEYLDYIISNLNSCYDNENDFEAELDCNYAKIHLSYIDKKLAYETFFSLIVEDYNGGYSYPDEYKKALEIIISNNDEAINYFSENSNAIEDVALRTHIMSLLIDDE